MSKTDLSQEPTIRPGAGARVSRITTRPKEGAEALAAVLAEAAADAAPGGLVGRRFGDYEILEEVARGGMGVVYKARQVQLNRVVALKMILAAQFADPDDVKRFRREAAAAARLDHPNVVQVFEIGEYAGRPFFSMPFVEGESLAHRLTRGPLPPADAARVMLGLARAIAHAHDRGVLHRDLKPANVLLTAEGEPRITDFGVAKILDQDMELTRTGVLLGTPGYMAPEQASGRRDEIGPAVDVYGLGAVMYAMLTGRPPFVGATALETLDQVRAAAPVSPGRVTPGLPATLSNICMKCLQKEPRLRHADAAELANLLAGFLDEQAVEARASESHGSLEIFVYDRQERVYARQFAGIVELGRQRDVSELLHSTSRVGDHTRLVIALVNEDTVSREHARIEPLDDTKVLLTNLSAKVGIRLSDGNDLKAGQSIEVALPTVFALGRKTIRIQQGLPQQRSRRPVADARSIELRISQIPRTETAGHAPAVQGRNEGLASGDWNDPDPGFESKPFEPAEMANVPIIKVPLHEGRTVLGRQETGGEELYKPRWQGRENVWRVAVAPVVEIHLSRKHLTLDLLPDGTLEAANISANCPIQFEDGAPLSPGSPFNGMLPPSGMTFVLGGCIRVQVRLGQATEDSEEGRIWKWQELLEQYGPPRHRDCFTMDEWLQALHEGRVIGQLKEVVEPGMPISSLPPDVWRLVPSLASWKMDFVGPSVVFSNRLPARLTVLNVPRFAGDPREATPARKAELRRSKEEEEEGRRRQAALDARLSEALDRSDFGAAKTALVMGAAKSDGLLATAVIDGREQIVRFLLQEHFTCHGHRAVEAVLGALARGHVRTAEMLAERGLDENLLELWSRDFIKKQLSAFNEMDDAYRGAFAMTLQAELTRLLELSRAGRARSS